MRHKAKEGSRGRAKGKGIRPGSRLPGSPGPARPSPACQRCQVSCAHVVSSQLRPETLRAVSYSLSLSAVRCSPDSTRTGRCGSTCAFDETSLQSEIRRSLVALSLMQSEHCCDVLMPSGHYTLDPETGLRRSLMFQASIHRARFFYKRAPAPRVPCLCMCVTSSAASSASPRSRRLSCADWRRRLGAGDLARRLGAATWRLCARPRAQGRPHGSTT